MDNDSEHLTLHVVPLSAQANDRWMLSDPYVEQVWSEYLGPTATLLARRLGRTLEERPGGVDVDLGDLATSLGIQPSIAVKALAIEPVRGPVLRPRAVDRRGVGLRAVGPGGAAVSPERGWSGGA